MTEPAESFERKRVVVGVVRENDKVLIVQRASVEQSVTGRLLKWVFPGGGVEPGESEEAAVIREIAEEAGVVVEVVSKISERMHPDFPVHISYFACTKGKDGTKVVRDPEISAVKWVKPAELLALFETSIDPGVAAYLGLKDYE